MMTTRISRRNFVKMAAASATLAAGGVLAGCAASTDQASTSASQETVIQPTPSQQNTEQNDTQSASVVYFTNTVSPSALKAVYDALLFSPTGKLAVKISTGETGSNYLRPELVGDFISGLSGTIVECNTAYGGDRSSTQRHLQLAQEHGFTAVADVDIMDTDGSISLPAAGGTHLTEDLVGTHFNNYGSWISLAHFKGHTMGGFGGAIKNCSIGIASSSGKALIHTAGASSTNISWGTPQDDFLESMAEAAKAVSDALGDRIVYVNVMNRISVDCDCDTNPAEPDMADIGILASTDPVALDQACVDLVYAAQDGGSVVKRIENRNGIHTLEHAEAIGLGSRVYQLVEID